MLYVQPDAGLLSFCHNKKAPTQWRAHIKTMVLPGHLAGGYLVTLALVSITHAGSNGVFTHEQLNVLLIIGTLAGELPDIDLIRDYFEQRRDEKHLIDHREYFTHAPSFWLAVSLVIVTSGYVAGSSFTQYVGWIILAGTWSHFILDSIEHGVIWLWPLTNKKFRLLETPDSFIEGHPGTIPYYWRFITQKYFKYWTCR